MRSAPTTRPAGRGPNGRPAVSTVVAGVAALALLALTVRLSAVATVVPASPPLVPSGSIDTSTRGAPADVTAPPITARPDTVAKATNADLRQATSTSSPPSPSRPNDKKTGGPLRSVILFLYGGRWHSYFVRECLPRLDAYLLRCFPYPLHVFHEGATADQKAAIASAAPHAPRVDFEDVGWVWKTLPKGVTESALKQWMSDGVQSKFQGRGYRVMCRFWTGIAWTLPSMDKYDFYWRLDTDSVLTKPVLVDPFRHVFVDRGCAYGYNRLKGENPHVATKLWETFRAWAARAVNDEEAVLTSADVDRVRSLALNPPPGTAGLIPVTDTDGNTKRQFWAPMFYNNFEMGTFALKRSKAYQSFFSFVDSNEPFGIFRYRWGDAPLHTLAVVAAVPDEKRCNVSQNTVGYKHAAKRLEPIVAPDRLPACPPARGHGAGGV